jgi:polysaccharide pyruvyl transferase WcaK-like protein
MEVILFGYYGYGNVGDDQCLASTVQMIKTMERSWGNIRVASGPMAVPFPRFNRWNLLAWVYYLMRSQALVLGGGSVFQSRTSVMSLLYYLGVLQLAYMLKCRVILVCHGWGPFRRSWHERATRWGVRHARRSWRTVSSPILGDPTFCDVTLFQSLGAAPGETVSRGVGIAMRSSVDTAQLKQDVQVRNLSVVIIQNQHSYDTHCDDYLSDIWSRSDIALDYLITDRYHAAIWASRRGIPWLAISDDPKLVDLASQTQQRCVANMALYVAHLMDMPKGFSSALYAWSKASFQHQHAVREWLNDAFKD